MWETWVWVDWVLSERVSKLDLVELTLVSFEEFCVSRSTRAAAPIDFLQTERLITYHTCASDDDDCWTWPT
jgi:hypothetical protein